MGISLESMAIRMPAVAGHPNRVAFRGVLNVVDSQSDKAPAGARGHRVILARRAAEEAIPSLLGMGLDYSPRLDGHDTRRKIGVITSAEIVGREIEVGGYLYGRDFPEMVEEIGRSATPPKTGLSGAVGRRLGAARASDKTADAIATGKGSRFGLCRADTSVPPHHAKSGRAGDRGLRATQEGAAGTGLGMSYEIADALVEDIQAAVWVLNRVTFTGAAVLRRDKAAYMSTWIELVDAAPGVTVGKEGL